MSTKHTPGKWQTMRDNFVAPMLVRDALHHTSLRIVFADPGMDIAYVLPFDGDNGNGNAQLIAAAPELLRLLTQAVDYLDPTTAGGWMLEAKALLEELSL